MKIITKLRENRKFMFFFPLILLVVLCVLFGIITKGNFLTVGNLKTMLGQCIVLGTIATGATFIFGSGNVNMSMGGTAALTAVIAGLIYQVTESVIAMLICSVLTGAMLSFLSVIISKLTKMTIITVTTVTMMLYPAMVSWILGANTINIPYKVYSVYQKMQVPVIVFVVFLIVCLFIFYKTSLGRKVSFIGSNHICGQLTGLAEDKILFWIFIIAGVGCGLGAFSTIIRTGVVSTTTLSGGNMDVILSIVIGGMPIFGGSKTKPYAGVIGAAVLTVLNSGLLMIGISSTMLQAVRGIIFMIFIVISWEKPQGLPVRGA